MMDTRENARMLLGAALKWWGAWASDHGKRMLPDANNVYGYVTPGEPLTDEQRTEPRATDYAARTVAELTLAVRECEARLAKCDRFQVRQHPAINSEGGAVTWRIRWLDPPPVTPPP